MVNGEIASPIRLGRMVTLMMTDNHGVWTLGCYGNRDIRTPNIDRLASEGMLFTRVFRGYRPDSCKNTP